MTRRRNQIITRSFLGQLIMCDIVELFFFLFLGPMRKTTSGRAIFLTHLLFRLEKERPCLSRGEESLPDYLRKVWLEE